MTTRQLSHIREKGAKLRLQGMAWRDISVALDILNGDGKPDPGMAYRIVIEGYEPSRIATRKRLGLSLICPTCKRLLLSEKRKARKDLFGLPIKTLRAMFENRR